MLHDLRDQFIHVIDLADRGDGIRTVVRTDDQGLRLKIGNAADAQVTPHMMNVVIEFGTERRVLNIVDGPVEALFPVHRQTGAARSQVGVVIRAEKQIENAIFF